MMGRFNRRHVLVIAVFTVLICSWAVGNIINSTTKDTGGNSQPLGSKVLESWNSELTLVLAILLISTVPLIAIFILHDKDWKALLSGSLLVGFWIITFLGGTLLVILNQNLISGVKIFDWIPWEISPAALPLVGKLGIGILVVLLGGLSIFVVYVNLVYLLKKKSQDKEVRNVPEFDFEEEKEEVEIEEDLSSTVNKAISDLHEGEDVRSTIIDSYREMCRVLEKRGERNDEFLTPREFEKAVIGNIPQVNEVISEITHLFEEARYSPHELKEEERKKAVTHLQNLKRRLI